MRKYLRQIEQAKQKAEHATRLALEAQLPMSELIAGVREDIEGFAAELGLTIIQRVMAAEIEQKLLDETKSWRPGHDVRPLIDAVWSLEKSDDVSTLAALTVPH